MAAMEIIAIIHPTPDPNPNINDSINDIHDILDDVNEETGLVEVHIEAQYEPVFVFLRSQDKTRDKRKYNEQLKYLYFMYKREGEYSERLLSDRRRIIEVNHLNEQTGEDIENDEAFIGVRKFYLEEQFTLTENTYFALEADIDNLVRHINSIPHSTREEVKVDIVVPNYHVEDLEPKDIRTVTIKKMINRNNSEEKLKAMDGIKKLLLFKEDLKELIKKEKVEKKRNNNIYMFDVTNPK
jgi:hypothetical protein